MDRRDFLTASAAASVGAVAARAAAAPDDSSHDDGVEHHEFKLKYAPHFGMFAAHAGDDLLDQLQFIADVGFRALEDNGMRTRTRSVQNAIAKKMQQLGLEMGVFVATGDFTTPTMASGDKDLRERVLADMRQAVEIAKRVNARWCTVVPGKLDHRLPMDYQTANVVETLKYCSAICEPSGLIIVLEPLNHWVNHPELFLSEIPQAYLICKAVDSPSCKILFDMYHQQVTEGNIINNIDRAWSEVAYFQTGDNPGRKEPTTGEMNYKNIFKHIYGKGFEGVLGMEHGNSKRGKEGELAVIRAYAECDSF